MGTPLCKILSVFEFACGKAAKDLDDGGTKGIDYFSLRAVDAAAFDFSSSASY